MINTWHNNRISEKLNKEFARDFSICDIDGLVRCNYKKDEVLHQRFIIYESKNEKEKTIGDSQLKSLRYLENSIDWSRFDNYSGMYVIKIIDLEKELRWFNLKGEFLFETDFKKLYEIFSAKIF